jgi:hypothetical protein
MLGDRDRAARQLRPHEVICVCGQRGMGKSSWVRALIRPIVRICFWDPLLEYAGTLGGACVTVPEFEARERKGLLYRGVLRLAVKPSSYDTLDMADEFDRFCAVCLRVGAMTVGVEEVSLVASPFEVPGHFAQLLAIGRHRACSVIVLGQRFAQFPRLATAQASRIVAFRQAEPSDKADLAKRIGEFCPGYGKEWERTEDFAGKLREPDPSRGIYIGHFLDWNGETGTVLRHG